MFIVMIVIGLIGLLASLVYLAEFARASRGDALFLPASTGSARRARRVSGMYIRGTMAEMDLRGAGDRLVDH
ncbi:hypothetical protein GCM10023085_03660 [Actinomadura viridis]|uniref:Uncharacterized protein n=1 Tax=Actinomadura viridis TaxID=58110 RepID=A0A931DMB8_9ACTN|nr:hypothetical protein [Actinomadura viridis]MBG6091183.1 hypothetical protein [Actinomadura viridis]